MVARYTRLIGLTLALGLASVPAAHAGPRISVHVGIGAPIVAPAPVVPVVPAYSGYVWQPGYRVWTRFGYRWVPGAWVQPAYGRPGWRGGRAYEHRGWDRGGRYWDRDRDRDRRHGDRDERGWRR